MHDLQKVQRAGNGYTPLTYPYGYVSGEAVKKGKRENHETVKSKNVK